MLTPEFNNCSRVESLSEIQSFLTTSSIRDSRNESRGNNPPPCILDDSSLLEKFSKPPPKK